MGRVINYKKLYSYISANTGTPYSFGKNDCAMLILKTRDLLFGTNLYKRYGNRYKNEIEAVQLIEQYGGYTGLLQDMGLTRNKINFEQVGDVLVTPRLDSILVKAGIYVGSYVFTVDLELGTCLTKLPDSYEVWR